MPLVFARIGRIVARHPWTVVGSWALVVVVGYSLAVLGLSGQGLFERVVTGEPQVPGSASQQGEAIIAGARDTGQTVTLVLSGVDPASTQLATAMTPVRAELAALDNVASVVDPLVLPGGSTNPVAKPLLASDGKGFLIVVELEPGLSDDTAASSARLVAARLAEVPGNLHPVAPTAAGLVGSTSLVLSAVTDQVRDDLRLGEAIALPVALLVMVIVFGGFLAAAMPMVGALASIAGGLAALLGATYLLDVDAAVVNVVTVLGLGLSIDYGLLIVQRFREELHRLLDEDGTGARSRRRRGDGAVEQALERTLATAGRTVAFSAVTVWVAIASLAVFRPSILRAVGIAGSAVVLVALATALTLVPALLRLSGRRLHADGVLHRVPVLGGWVARAAEVRSDDGVFARFAERVARRPWWWLAGSLAVLVVLAAPVTGMQLRNSGIDLLPRDSTQRQFVDQITTLYPQVAAPAVTVVARTTVAQATTWADQLTHVAHVSSVDAPAAAGEYVTIGLRLDTTDAGDAVATQVVHDVRALSPGFSTWVTGQAAGQIDFVDALRDGLPVAALIVVVAVLALVLLMTGSLVMGVKVLLTNALSLAASLGVLVWGFQDKHLQGLLGFESTGGVETYVIAMVVAFAFGLAMDYEVFLLSRVVELHRAGADDLAAVRVGLQRSARIITSAAAVMVVVFAGFVAGSLLIIKEVGFALAVAVLIDVTLVRMVLVPATMTVLGRWNWWAPAVLRDRIARFTLLD